MSKQAIIPRPPSFIFDRQRDTNLVLNEEVVTFMLQPNPDGTPKIEYIRGVGMFNYYQGTPYPAKGFVYPEAMFALNQMKRFTLEVLKVSKNPIVFAGLVVARKQALASYNTLFDKVFGDHSVKNEYLCHSAYAVEAFLLYVMKDEKFAHNVAQFVEYDDAYRYRFQDIITELDVEAFKKNPRKELDRLVKLMDSREGQKGVFAKLQTALKLAKILLLVPSIRKSVCENIHHLKRGEFDENDRYWVSVIDNGYSYFGMSSDERLKLYAERPLAYKIRV